MQLGTMAVATTMRCSRCGNEYPSTSEFFGPDRRASSGLQSACRECTRAYDRVRRSSPSHLEAVAAYRAAHKKEIAARRRAYVAANKERVAEQKKRFYLEHRGEILEYGRQYREANRDRIKAQQKQWRTDHADELSAIAKERYLANPDAAKRRSARWYKENRERAREMCRLWRKENADSVRCYSRSRKARKRGAEGYHTAGDISAQLLRQRGRCYWCKVKLGDVYHADHVVPLIMGGSNWPENIVVSCPTCNLSKGGKHPTEWAGVLC